MRFKDLTKRLTGISCPIFGISWEPLQDQIAIARRVITHLEDRRVLHAASEMEDPVHCVQSILRVRDFLSHELGALTNDDGLGAHLRAMRAACRKFLDVMQQNPEFARSGLIRGDFFRWVFDAALGELRGAFGIQIAQIAAKHGLDIEDELASILPAEDAPDLFGQPGE